MSAANAIDAAFAEQVREARKASGLSQHALSQRLPHPLNRQVTVGRIETADRKVSIGEAMVIASALGFAITQMQPPPSCGSCYGTPPAGFTCNTCGGAA